MSPPCVAHFEGDNFAATYQGVTADKIKLVFFSSKPNEQVDAILEFGDGGWAAAEAKIGARRIPEAEANLIKLRDERVNIEEYVASIDVFSRALFHMSRIHKMRKDKK